MPMSGRMCHCGARIHVEAAEAYLMTAWSDRIQMI